MNRLPTSATEAGGRMPDAECLVSRLSPPSFHRPPITVHRPRTTDHRLPPSGLRPLASGSRASRGAAFTLIELMVAAVITMLLLLGMTGIFDQSIKAWRVSSRRADAERELRAALAQIERDLANLVVSSNLPIYVNVRDTNRVNIPGSLRSNMPARAGSPGVDWANVSAVLFFASTVPVRSGQPGELAGIGYFVAWDPASNGGNGAWNLYRRLQPPTNLFSALTNRLALATISSSSPGPYQTNSLAAPEILAANVLNFWVAPVVFDSNNVPKTLPTNAAGNLDITNQLVNGFWITNRPAYFQLELTAYGNEQVRNFSGGSSTARRAMWGDTSNIAKFGRSFIWRVGL